MRKKNSDYLQLGGGGGGGGNTFVQHKENRFFFIAKKKIENTIKIEQHNKWREGKKCPRSLQIKYHKEQCGVYIFFSAR